MLAYVEQLKRGLGRAGTFSASVGVDCEYEDAFGEGVGEVPKDSKDLAGHCWRVLSIQSFAILTFIVIMLCTGDGVWGSDRGEVGVGFDDTQPDYAVSQLPMARLKTQNSKLINQPRDAGDTVKAQRVYSSR